LQSTPEHCYLDAAATAEARVSSAGDQAPLSRRAARPRGVKLGPANRGRRLDAAERQAKVIEAKAIDD